MHVNHFVNRPTIIDIYYFFSVLFVLYLLDSFYYTNIYIIAPSTSKHYLYIKMIAYNRLVVQKKNAI